MLQGALDDRAVTVPEGQTVSAAKAEQTDVLRRLDEIPFGPFRLLWEYHAKPYVRSASEAGVHEFAQ